MVVKQNNLFLILLFFSFMIIEKEESLTFYKCEIDKRNLWVKLSSGIELALGNCDHFKWVSVGNACYPIKTIDCTRNDVDEIVKKSIKAIDYSTHYFLLIPK